MHILILINLLLYSGGTSAVSWRRAKRVRRDELIAAATQSLENAASSTALDSMSSILPSNIPTFAPSSSAAAQTALSSNQGATSVTSQLPLTSLLPTISTSMLDEVALSSSSATLITEASIAIPLASQTLASNPTAGSHAPDPSLSPATSTSLTFTSSALEIESANVPVPPSSELSPSIAQTEAFVLSDSSLAASTTAVLTTPATTATTQTLNAYITNDSSANIPFASDSFTSITLSLNLPQSSTNPPFTSSASSNPIATPESSTRLLSSALSTLLSSAKSTSVALADTVTATGSSASAVVTAVTPLSSSQSVIGSSVVVGSTFITTTDVSNGGSTTISDTQPASSAAILTSSNAYLGTSNASNAATSSAPASFSMITKSSFVSNPVKPTGSVNSAVPTVITSSPPASTTITGDQFASNLAQAIQYNELFNTLTAASACQDSQVACVGGNLGECTSLGVFSISPCSGNTQCFALPMNTTSGVQVGCFDRAVAAKILGASDAASSAPGTNTFKSTTAVALTSTAGSSSAVAASTPVTITFDPSAPIPSSMVTATSQTATSPSSLTSTVVITIGSPTESDTATAPAITETTIASTTLTTRTRTRQSQTDQQPTVTRTQQTPTTTTDAGPSRSVVLSIISSAPTRASPTSLTIIIIHKTKTSTAEDDMPKPTVEPNGGAKATGALSLVSGAVTVTVKETETATVTTTTTATEHETATVRT